MKIERDPSHLMSYLWSGILFIVVGLGVIGAIIISQEEVSPKLSKKVGLLEQVENTESGWAFYFEKDSSTYLISGIVTSAINFDDFKKVDLSSDTCTLYFEQGGNYHSIYQAEFGSNKIVAYQDVLDEYYHNELIGQYGGFGFVVFGGLIIMLAYRNRNKKEELLKVSDEEYFTYKINKELNSTRWFFVIMLFVPYIFVGLKLLEKSFDLNLSFEEVLKLIEISWMDLEFNYYHLGAVFFTVLFYFLADRKHNVLRGKALEEADVLKRITMINKAYYQIVSLMAVATLLLIVSLLTQPNIAIALMLPVVMVFTGVYYFPKKKVLEQWIRS